MLQDSAGDLGYRGWGWGEGRRTQTLLCRPADSRPHRCHCCRPLELICAWLVLIPLSLSVACLSLWLVQTLWLVPLVTAFTFCLNSSHLPAFLARFLFPFPASPHRQPRVSRPSSQGWGPTLRFPPPSAQCPSPAPSLLCGPAHRLPALRLSQPVGHGTKRCSMHLLVTSLWSFLRHSVIAIGFLLYRDP